MISSWQGFFLCSFILTTAHTTTLSLALPIPINSLKFNLTNGFIACFFSSPLAIPFVVRFELNLLCIHATKPILVFRKYRTISNCLSSPLHIAFTPNRSIKIYRISLSRLFFFVVSIFAIAISRMNVRNLIPKDCHELTSGEFDFFLFDFFSVRNLLACSAINSPIYIVWVKRPHV